MFKTVVSKDGRTIAFDQTGQGPAVILVGGAFSERRYEGSIKLAQLLSAHFTVFNYDRRGRGDSTNQLPWSVTKEIEDIAALIEAAGGSASAFGLSSGAVLALRAAAAGLKIEKLALYQPPFRVDDSIPLPPADLPQVMDRLLAQGQRGRAVKTFMTKAFGMPGIIVTIMRFIPGMWPRLTALAHTLPYDYAIMGDNVNGQPLNPAEWRPVTVPTLVLAGTKSPAGLQKAAADIAALLPQAGFRALVGQTMNVSMDVLAAELLTYFKETPV